MILFSLLASIVGFPSYPTCHPATAAWDYAHLLRMGFKHETAWESGVTPWHDGTEECQIRVEASIEFNRRTWR